MPKPPAFQTNITTQEANAPRTAPQGCIPLNPSSSSPCGTADNPRVVRFASTPPRQGGQHTIDGKKFDEDPADTKTVTLNTVEEWQIENATAQPNISHPFHIHINPFQIVEVFDPNQQVQTTNNNGTVDKYVAPDKVVDASVQCPITADNGTWKDCHNDEAYDKTPRVWWDVFPIPSGRNITFNGTAQLVPGHFRMRSRFVDFPGEYVIHCHILAHEDRGMMALVEVRKPGMPSLAGLYHHH